MNHHLPAGSLRTEGWDLELTPERAGWTYSGLRALDMEAGRTYRFETGPEEMALLPLSARDVEVGCEGESHTLVGRDGAFDGPTDFVYVPRDSEVSVRAGVGGRLMLPSARCERRFPVRYVAADAVPVELRGAGQCSREVHNFMAAHVFEADKLIAVEVLTPGGNWSSYPPHKHDEDVPGEECPLEEVYYYEVTGEHGMAYQRVYGHPDKPIDVLAEVRAGDVVCMPHGWHGPSMAVPGYDLYYLNVMAGPSEDRAWLIRDDPSHGWIRKTWEDQEIDPRLPLGGAR